MNHTELPPILFSGRTALMVLLAGLMVAFCAGLAGRVFLTARRPKPDGPPCRSGNFGEFSWLFAPIIVAATFAGISASERWRPDGVRDLNPPSTAERSGRPAMIPHETIKLPAAGKGRQTHSNDESSSTAGLAQRPAWIDQPPVKDSLGERIVISSQQYSTRDEAEQELVEIASERLTRDLQQLFPGESTPPSWLPTAAAIKQFAVKQQYVEIADRDFGTFTHPMYRVWWQLELSPEVRTEFLPSWRQSMTSTRIHRVGLIATSLVLSASLLALYHRLMVLTGGTWRHRLRAFTTLVAIAWLAAIRYFV